MGLYDINAAALTQNYDFIVSTVVLMFLDADRIPAIIRNMQEHTNPGGYHLIVCAMDTEDYPCQMPFSFTFKEGELAEYYKDWELVKYNENPGHLHRRDENGHRIQLRFATMLAKKKREKRDPSILLFAFYKQVEQGDLNVVHLPKEKPSP